MQESKYCEDIVPAIKASLEAAGYINEHDRLGHFESKVPADTFFALASKYENVRLFALQFKAPDNHIRWDLTHTRDQFDKIRLKWHQMIYYALPWYTDLIDSSRGLDLCAFVDPVVFPDIPSRIVTSKHPIPDEYLARLICAYCYDKYPHYKKEQESLKSVYNLILEFGPDYVIDNCVTIDESCDTIMEKLRGSYENSQEKVTQLGILPAYIRKIAIRLA